jgi:hypothetical protein
MRRAGRGLVTDIRGGVVGGVGVGYPIGDHRRDHGHDVEGVGQRLLIPRARPWRPCHRSRRR